MDLEPQFSAAAYDALHFVLSGVVLIVIIVYHLLGDRRSHTLSKVFRSLKTKNHRLHFQEIDISCSHPETDNIKLTYIWLLRINFVTAAITFWTNAVIVSQAYDPGVALHQRLIANNCEAGWDCFTRRGQADMLLSFIASVNSEYICNNQTMLTDPAIHSVVCYNMPAPTALSVITNIAIIYALFDFINFVFEYFVVFVYNKRGNTRIGILIALICILLIVWIVTTFILPPFFGASGPFLNHLQTLLMAFVFICALLVGKNIRNIIFKNLQLEKAIENTPLDDVETQRIIGQMNDELRRKMDEGADAQDSTPTQGRSLFFSKHKFKSLLRRRKQQKYQHAQEYEDKASDASELYQSDMTS